MQFRIGINIGDVIHDEARLYGDGVNVAARLEAVAEPGGICISGAAYDQVRNKLTTGAHRWAERYDRTLEEVFAVP
jgi:adenylate cyclase